MLVARYAPWKLALLVSLISLYSCFVSPGLAMYLGLLFPTVILLIHNVITYILVVWSLLKANEDSQLQQISKRLQSAVLVFVLVCLTWCFGALAIYVASFTFRLIFCVANVLQVTKNIMHLGIKSGTNWLFQMSSVLTNFVAVFWEAMPSEKSFSSSQLCLLFLINKKKWVLIFNSIQLSNYFWQLVCIWNP